ncbi:MAG: glycosyltransferase [Polyangiaceae bacterium]
MALNLALVGLELERALLRVVLAALFLDRVRLAYQGAVSREPAEPPPLTGDDLPRLTVQLPLRNEEFVAERLVHAIAALDWPKDRVEVQILDTSDDGTCAIVDRLAEHYRALGHDMHVLRRPNPEGFKAGSLAYGLQFAKGDYVAVFDADSVPEPTFLRRLMPHFLADPAVGMVQARWGYLNESENLLTRVQGLLLDSLLAVEQPVRSRSNEIFQFNGTSGIWSRACLDAAGGWSGRSVTEDRDVSFRALLAGYRFVHVAGVEVKTELPESMLAYSAQQERWTRGSTELARTLFWPIVKSDLPLSDRFDLLKHLARRAIVLFLAIGMFTFPLTTFGTIEPLVDYSVAVDAFTFGAIVLAVAMVFARARHNLGRSFGGSLAYALAAVGLYLGTAINTSCALVAGCFQKEAEFERTPKVGDSPAGALAVPRYFAKRAPLVVLQLVVGGAYAWFTALALRSNLHLHAAFCLFVTWSHLWVGFSGARELATAAFAKRTSRETSPGAVAAAARAGELAARAVRTG